MHGNAGRVGLEDFPMDLVEILRQIPDLDVHFVAAAQDLTRLGLTTELEGVSRFEVRRPNPSSPARRPSKSAAYGCARSVKVPGGVVPPPACCRCRTRAGRSAATRH